MLKPISDLVDQLLFRLPACRTENILLKHSINRVVATDVPASIAQPSYNESLRDGFALHCTFTVSIDGSAIFEINGEIAAGGEQELDLLAQQACRVTTGAYVPSCCARVVPKEQCRIDGRRLIVRQKVLQAERTYISSKGSEVRAGEMMVRPGTVLRPVHLANLAAVAVDQIQVFEQPRVGFLCTGKELVRGGTDLAKGQKVSSNQYLLSGLISLYGGRGFDLGNVDDDSLQLQNALLAAGRKNYDMLVSTGGTGPGKFDLIEKIFRQLGGQVYCTSLGIRPGKSVVIGKINSTVFCGLPGPPAAVEALLHELVGPILLKLQGVQGSWPQRIQAYLQDDFDFKPQDVVQLKSGMHCIKGGRCTVRRAGNTEYSTSYVIVPEATQRLVAGTLVDVHLQSSPFHI